MLNKEMNDIKAVVFDFDMTLVDSSYAIHKCANLLAREFGLPEVTREKVLEGIGLTVDNSWRLYWGNYKKEWLEFYRDNFRGAEQSDIRLFDGTLTALKKIKKAGIKIGVASNRRFAFRAVDAIGLAPYVDTVVGLEDITKAKPDPEALLTAINRLQAGPSNSFYVGDTDIDMKTAAAASVRSVGSATGFFGKDGLYSAGAWRVVTDIADLPHIIGLE